MFAALPIVTSACGTATIFSNYEAVTGERLECRLINKSICYVGTPPSKDRMEAVIAFVQSQVEDSMKIIVIDSELSHDSLVTVHSTDFANDDDSAFGSRQTFVLRIDGDTIEVVDSFLTFFDP